MGEQAKKGKMLEYAVLRSLEQALRGNNVVTVDKDKALLKAKEFYNMADSALVKKMDRGAAAAVGALIKLEPKLMGDGSLGAIELRIQGDSKGIEGDVRDILCVRTEPDWELGISCKHNHSAVKHSRLSSTIDFGEKWFGIPCSLQYFSEIEPIFSELERLKKLDKSFKELSDKANRFYKPVLEAFIKEIKRLDRDNPGKVPGAMLNYLLGRQDFYKVIVQDAKKTTKIEAFNLTGSLNLPEGKKKAETKTGMLKLPDKIYDISYKPKSNNTIIITFDKGWVVSFRIHNARTQVENSLKFDIKLAGVPTELHTQIEAWQKEMNIC